MSSHRPSRRRPRTGSLQRERERREQRRALERLRRLHLIAQRLTVFESVDALGDVLRIVGEVVPVRSVVLAERPNGVVATHVWNLAGVAPGEMALAEAHAREAMAFLCGTVDGLKRSARRYVTLPLAVDAGAVLGVLQVEPSRDVDEDDLEFLATVVNQLAIALSRYHAWRRDQELRRRAEAAERYQRDSVAILSHDLRSPLTAIVLNAETALLLTEEPGVRARLEAIIRLVERMRRLVQALLDVARLEAGQLVLERRPLDLVALVREVVDQHGPQAAEKHQRLEVNLSHELPPVNADRARLEAVVSNLVENAIKFSRVGGTVRVEGRAMDGEVEIAVHDTGPGIPADSLAHVFDRFWQGEGARSLGVGLGLAIAKGFTEAHGGRLLVESQPGRGSVFRVRLPVDG